ncbi:Phytanoyl-CoA dioxygenase (PhyH) [Mesorhizobium albiziae]|uniref:Phytanoyl-CoA dioxygenase (PhyH) n=1 Tax=Neomesorhizobium albiziae TaxID=335020 RepID=A0A1I4DU63_9HYPH|nr:phytanoyl-CoA dioxygenase family protein [Mesorhizobium albiziae]GLS32781.1 hypothetical protein GCM10007937_44910 [Mesorhizobium albiziae]SFK97228.1 Phytanoyl-CoA dioxygenase (PhyH) [Mesorhizobium albiziae]
MAMVERSSVPRYGVKEQTATVDRIDVACEELRLVGFSIVDPGFSDDYKAHIAKCFDTVAQTYFTSHGGRDALRSIDEHNTIRGMLAYDHMFLELAKTPTIISLCERLLGNTFILNQQNGVINPAVSDRYNQAYYHRDLPYQHFTTSRPLAINALYCVDAFTVENGATRVVPGSHKQEAFPSDSAVHGLETVALARAGCFIVLDCMTFHCGGRNVTLCDRRAINHVYTLPFIKQQIYLKSMVEDSGRLSPADRQLLDLDNQPAADAAGYLETRRARLLRNPI